MVKLTLPSAGGVDRATVVADELGIRVEGVRAVLDLLEGGNTVPFIARYRKEATGGLDEVQIRAIRDRAEYLAELDQRRQSILHSIEEQRKLTDELRAALQSASTKAELEDLYRPFKPKRRTRAGIAIERGLEPLADLLADGRVSDTELQEHAARFVDAAHGLPTVVDALAGARDIVAERISDDATVRAWIRRVTAARGVLESRVAAGKEGEASKFQDYFAFAEPIRSVPSHRILAIRRGEAEEYLISGIVAPEEEIAGWLERRFVTTSRAPQQMAMTVTDAYRRLIAPSVEGELRLELKQRADEEAIAIFGANLEGLLLAPPAGARVILGVDPGFRTGCKLAVVGRTGALLTTSHVFLHQEQRAAAEVRRLIDAHGVELVGIGNGTASRETERLVRNTVSRLDPGLRPEVVLVNEAGASVYSASELAREEFPELDLTLRSAISIARRLQDPLAELVKIDPKAIGVGQYQHDVSQPRLKRRLDETVESCVNRVGVELNTASAPLLSYVAGIGASVAQRIVEHRDLRGAFRTRSELRAVGGVGPKTFEQAAGFLRIRDGLHPLDASAVHPERYTLVERIAAELGVELASLVGNPAAVNRIDPAAYVEGEVGLPTLVDILEELRKPGRDPRQTFSAPSFRDDVQTIADLREGIVLQGRVTNVVAFGAFVDIGVHQDGLVHVSQLAERFVHDPAAVVRVGDTVTVRVLSVDMARKRIGLSMKLANSHAIAEGMRPATRRAAPPTRVQEGTEPNGMRITRR